MVNYTDKNERYALVRKIAEEGIVLLKNEGVLPLGSEKVAVFGRTQLDLIKCGTGSAFCTCEHCAEILDGMEAEGISCDEILAEKYRRWTAENPIRTFDVWGSGSHINEEMPLSEEDIAACAARGAEKAVFIIGRTAGENDDAFPTVGDYLLSDGEEEMLSALGRHFRDVIVVINSGNLMDMSFSLRPYVKALLLLSMPGMEGGHALARVLSGAVSPSGKLTDTAITSYEKCPSAQDFGSRGGIIQKYKEDIFVGYRYYESFASAGQSVLYPFGFGLSYAEFAAEPLSFSATDTEICAEINVRNIGKRAGKETVMLYSSSPAGTIDKPRYELRAFAKTRLLEAGESETLRLCFNTADMACFDDSGKTGERDAWVMEAGRYGIFCGNNAEKLQPCGTYDLPEMRVIKRCVHLDTRLDERLRLDGSRESIEHIAPDPADGIIVAPAGKTRVKLDFADGASETLFNISVHGTYHLLLEGADGLPLPYDDFEIRAGRAEIFGGNAVFSAGKVTLSVKPKRACASAALVLAKDDSPAVISGEKSLIEGGRFCECALYVVPRAFSDDADMAHGFSLARMHTPGRYATYRLEVEKAGIYDFSLRYYNPYDDMLLSDCFSVLVSNVRRELGSVVLKKTAQRDGAVIYKTSEPFRLALPHGECYLKIVSATRTSPEIAYIEVKPSSADAAEAVRHADGGADETKTEEKEYIRRIPEGYADGMFARFVRGEISAEDIVREMSDDELAALTCGNEKGQIGYSEKFGIPEAYWADGPVGLRLERNTTVYPSGTMLACTWNTSLAEEFGRAIGAECLLYNIDMWLAPGMNIHRNPLCGRSFEYYSEDPLVTGRIAASVVCGVQECGVGATIKHFAANSTEYRRLQSDSYISGRALREIYMRGFEIAIKEASPYAIMTSYNFINGTKVPEYGTICREIMRDEFGYCGMLVTDWENNSVHVRELAAGHDLKMASGNAPAVADAIRSGELSRGRVEESACRILEFIAKTAGKNIK